MDFGGLHTVFFYFAFWIPLKIDTRLKVPGMDWGGHTIFDFTFWLPAMFFFFSSVVKNAAAGFPPRSLAISFSLRWCAACRALQSVRRGQTGEQAMFGTSRSSPNSSYSPSSKMKRKRFPLLLLHLFIFILLFCFWCCSLQFNVFLTWGKPTENKR